MTLFVFLILAFVPLYFDIYLHSKSTSSNVFSAMRWAAIYIGSALLFALYLLLDRGGDAAGLFLTGYVLEKSLSVDNLIVFGAVFAYFGVKGELQHRVLRWGILGAVVLRLTFVGFGIFAFAIFGRLLEVVFGAFVLFSAWQIYHADGDGEEIDHNARWYIRYTKRFLPVTANDPDKFFSWEKVHGIPVMKATPLFLCLVAMEFTDIAFAFDSVPVVIAVTREPLLVFSSIMFAVLGLRSLYFVLDAVKAYAYYLEKAILIVLGFVAVKLIAHGIFDLTIAGPAATLILILVILASAALLSLARKPAHVPPVS